MQFPNSKLYNKMYLVEIYDSLDYAAQFIIVLFYVPFDSMRDFRNLKKTYVQI